MGRHHAHDGPLSCWSSCKGALIPGPYGQRMTLIARETLVQNFKIRGGPICANFPRICTYVWLLWTPVVGLNGSKSSGEIDTKYVSGAIYFLLRNKAWVHFDL